MRRLYYVDQSEIAMEAVLLRLFLKKSGFLKKTEIYGKITQLTSQMIYENNNLILHAVGPNEKTLKCTCDCDFIRLFVLDQIRIIVQNNVF